MNERLEYYVRTFCVDHLNVTRGRYDGSDKWIKRRLLDYALIRKDINSKRGIRENAKHAYNFIHALCDANDRARIRHLYKFYRRAVRLYKH